MVPVNLVGTAVQIVSDDFISLPSSTWVLEADVGGRIPLIFGSAGPPPSLQSTARVSMQGFLRSPARAPPFPVRTAKDASIAASNSSDSSQGGRRLLMEDDKSLANASHPANIIGNGTTARAPPPATALQGVDTDGGG